MSIIEDSINLSKTGRWICGCLFIAGCINIFIAWSQASQIPVKYHRHQEEILVRTALPSRPEELKSPHGGLPPRNTQERRIRVMELASRINMIKDELGPNPPKTNRDTLKAGVEKGAIHPYEAGVIAEEIRALATPKPESTPIYND